MRLGWLLTGATAATLAFMGCSDDPAAIGDPASSSSGSSTSSSSGSGDIATTSSSGASSGKTSSSSSSGGKTSSSSSSSGGSSSSSGGKTDGGIGDGGTTGTVTIKSGEIYLVGTTKDGQVVYTSAANNNKRQLEAAPLTGGAATIIGTIDEDGDASVAGNAVVYWTDIDPNAGVGTVNVWTKAAGAKVNVATESIPGYADATEDGSKIMFSFNSPADTADFAITSPGAPQAVASATTGIVPKVNVVAPNCAASFGFVGKAFVSVHCPGNGQNLTKASLVYLPDAASPTPVTLIDGTATANSLKPLYTANKTGTRVAVIGITNSQLRVVTLAGGAVATIENNVGYAFLNDDASKVFYRKTDNSLWSAASVNNATPAASPAGATNLVTAGNIAGVLDVSPNNAYAVFRKLAPAGAADDFPRADLNLIDTTTAAQAGTPLIATATGGVAGFTDTSSHVLYLADMAGDTGIGKLKVRPVAGGAEREVAASATLVRTIGGGTKVTFMGNPQVAGQVATVDISAFDAASNAAAAVLVSGADPYYEVSSGKLVYVLPGATGGLYTMPIP